LLKPGFFFFEISALIAPSDYKTDVQKHAPRQKSTKQSIRSILELGGQVAEIDPSLDVS